MKMGFYSILVIMLKVTVVFLGAVVCFIFVFFFLVSIEALESLVKGELIITIPAKLYLPLFAFLSLIASGVYSYFLWYGLKRNWGTWIFLNILFTILSIMVAFSSTPRHHTELFDVKRISDIKQLQFALDSYFKDQGVYPPTPVTCVKISVLKKYLVNKYIPSIPHDGGLTRGHPDYEIAISQDRQSYVLRAILLDERSPLLENDEDGELIGCNCDDPAFCLTTF